MAFARVTIVRLTGGAMKEILRRVEAEVAPAFRSQEGFVAYYGIADGEDSGLTVTIWETREQADRSAAMAGGWVAANLGGRIAAAETHVGEVVFSAIDHPAATADIHHAVAH